MRWNLNVCVGCVAFAACGVSLSIATMTVEPPSDPAKSQDDADHHPAAGPSALDAIKALVGEWMMKDEQGQMIVAAKFDVTSGGHAVREIMFPGAAHEMTNMYHMDGPALVVTHYCAAGNQPTMKANHVDAGKPIVFKFERCTNLAKPGDQCMGSLTVDVTDADHVKQIWKSVADGKESGEVVFELVRKK